MLSVAFGEVNLLDTMFSNFFLNGQTLYLYLK